MGLEMPSEKSGRRSLSFDKDLVEYIEKHLEKHKVERLKDGKGDSIVSVLREAFFLWCKEKGLPEDVLKFLGQQK